MRIMHVAETAKGGIASYLSELVPAQTAEFGAHNICVLIPDRDLGEVTFDGDCNVQTFGCKRRSWGALLNLYGKFSALLREFNPDIVHLHSSFAGFVGRMRIFVLYRRPVIVYCPHGWSFGRESSLFGKLVYSYVERVLALRTDHIINISRFEQNLAETYGLPRKKMEVIYHGIADRPSEARRAWPGDDRKVRILFVGRLDHQKGFDVALRLIDELPHQFHLYVAGANVLRHRTRGWAEMAGRVHHLGWLSRHDLNRYYKAADYVLMPSRWEGFGLVAIEAMKNGVPVISSDRGALPEINVDGETGYVFDIDNLASVVARLVATDEASRRRLGEQARRRYLRTFTADRMNSASLKLYNELVSGGHGCQATGPL